MTQMLGLSNKDFKITMVNILEGLMEKEDNKPDWKCQQT